MLSWISEWRNHFGMLKPSLYTQKIWERVSHVPRVSLKLALTNAAMEANCKRNSIKANATSKTRQKRWKRSILKGFKESSNVLIMISQKNFRKIWISLINNQWDYMKNGNHWLTMKPLKKMMSLNKQWRTHLKRIISMIDSGGMVMPS